MIWIRIVSKDGSPATSAALGVPLAARFGDSVGDIGRGVGCTLVLPDPNREISRKQALVTCQGGRHLIRPIGSNVDIVLNGRVLPVDVETPLDVGAEIRVGPYLMRVEHAAADAPAPAPARPAAQQPSPPTPPARSPMTPPARASGPAAARPGSAAALPPAAPRNAPSGPPVNFNAPDRAAKAGVFDDLLNPLPAQPGSGRAPQQPSVRPLPLPDERAAAKPNAAPATPAHKDARHVPPVAPVQKVVPPQSPPPSAGAAARPARAPSPPSAGQPASGAATPSSANRSSAANDEFVGALYGGLGLPVPAPAERSAQTVRLIGELLRESLAGTIELLAARQIAKKNLGASATMLQTRGNNPLKFSPNVDAALTHLLGPPLRGFIGPRDAVHDALGDLRAHQVAMLAGMRAALEAVLERFDPVALEARLAPKGMMDQLMPLNRRARLWETFGEQYASILREVEDDWDALFGKAFLVAYERQLAELARAPTVDGDSEA